MNHEIKKVVEGTKVKRAKGDEVATDCGQTNQEPIPATTTNTHSGR